MSPNDRKEGDDPAVTQRDEGKVGELQNLFMVAVFHEVDSGAKTLDWFEGQVPAGGIDGPAVKDATAALVEMGLIEQAEQARKGGVQSYCLTERGRAFYQEVLTTIADAKGYIDWRRVGEIRFP